MTFALSPRILPMLTGSKPVIWIADIVSLNSHHIHTNPPSYPTSDLTEIKAGAW